MQLFQLKAVIIAGQKNCNGGYRVWEDDLGLFDAREKAEEGMRIVVKERQWDKFFAFFVYERGVNPALNEEGFQSVASYYPDGTLYCDSPYDEACKKVFRGRAADTIKLKVGDLGWCWDGKTLEPCLVFAIPFTKEKFAAYCRKNGRDPDTISFDYSDDCYGVYTYNHNHWHPATWRVFPYNETITQRNMARLLETKKWWDDGCPQ